MLNPISKFKKVFKKRTLNYRIEVIACKAFYTTLDTTTILRCRIRKPMQIDACSRVEDRLRIHPASAPEHRQVSTSIYIV